MSMFKAFSSSVQSVFKTVEVAAKAATTTIEVAGKTVNELDRWTDSVYINNEAQRIADRKDAMRNIAAAAHLRRAKAYAELLNLLESDDKFKECYKSSEATYKELEAELLAKFGQ